MPPSEVVQKAVEAALLLVRDVEGQRLAVASKFVVIASKPVIARRVVAQLATHDTHIQCAAAARDLGIDVSGAAKPTRQTIVKFGKLTTRAASASSAEQAHGRRRHIVRRQWRRRRRGSARQEREQQRRARCGGRGRCLTMEVCAGALVSHCDLQHTWVPIRATWKDPRRLQVELSCRVSWRLLLSGRSRSIGVQL